jgi:nucleotide-binding universal stress UspA family protein
MTIKRILVPVDFSPGSDEALRYAVELARPLRASVHLLHVVEDRLAAGMWSADAYTTDVPGLQVNIVEDAEAHLERIIPTIAGAKYGLEHDVRTGAPAATIVAFAQEVVADLIVMGTHGRTGLSHALMGSVAEQVVRTAPCPVLTLRAAPSTRQKPRKSARASA